uniref:Uncharacterized protein n=1 Tax=viral metagenome TaxID=1070528 RepID=A0A6H1ZA80_9ZZZZ
MRDKCEKGVRKMLENTQYFIKEFLHSDKKAVEVKKGGVLEAIIVFEDGTEQRVNGKLAIDILEDIRGS